MIFGIGTDIVEIERLQKLLDRYGDRTAQKILSPYELTRFQGVNPKRQASFLAKRFASKEAFIKALGTGFVNGLNLTDIETRHDDKGKPYLVFYKRVLQFTQEQKITRSHLSVSDERRYSQAFVILEYQS